MKKEQKRRKGRRKKCVEEREDVNEWREEWLMEVSDHTRMYTWYSVLCIFQPCHLLLPYT